MSNKMGVKDPFIVTSQSVFKERCCEFFIMEAYFIMYSSNSVESMRSQSLDSITTQPLLTKSETLG